MKKPILKKAASKIQITKNITDDNSQEIVLFNTDKEEFLAKVEDKGPETNILYWTDHPSDALIFTSPDQATEEAKHIVKNMGYTLDICRLVRKGEQIMLELLFFLEPSKPDDTPRNTPIH